MIKLWSGSTHVALLCTHTHNVLPFLTLRWLPLQMYDVVLKEASAIILLHSEVKVSQLVWDRTYRYMQ